MAFKGAGEYRERLVIERPDTRQNEFGETELADSDHWHDVATVWAAVKTLSSREQERSRLVDLQTTHTVTIRYTTCITSDCRFRWISNNNRILDVIGAPIDVDGRHVELEIACSEGRPQRGQ